MSASDVAIVAALVFAWGTLSARLERFDVTAPITFVLAGLLLTHGPLAPLGYAPSHELIKDLGEMRLVVVLFSDASRVGLRDLRADMGLCLRLLGIGLPLTIGLGVILAVALFGGMSIWLALLVGAALAPTDAALGASMMVNPAVPARIRRLVNVESGLNDGIATPFVLIAVAGASAGHSASTQLAEAVAELAIGLLVGAAVGGAGGFLVKAGRRRGWVAGGFAGTAVLGLAVCAYASALALHGNGFIAAFVGGLPLGAAGGRRAEGGPKVMIINERAGSGGDAMPWYFKRAGVGKLIGTRTWGGLVGMAGGPALMDGGFVGAPSSGIYNPLSGEWEVENIGVAPDIEVEQDPALVRKGR